jgi:two-component system, OmpR family, KDP operon response regulator KdpE
VTRKRVLICDDDDQMLRVASRLFVGDGWTVVGAVEHAAAALMLASSLHPEIVVLDVGLTGLSGLDIIPDLVAAGSAVVVCSSFGSSYTKALDIGASAIVDKSELLTLLDVANAVLLAHESDQRASA